MSEKGMDLTTPVGRIVWGHPTKPRVQKHSSGPMKGQNKTDPTTGQPIMEVSFGVAYPKADFAASIWPTMSAEIATGYPTATPPRFAFKYQDGDGVDGKGVSYAQREGYAGCYVLSFNQRINETFAPPGIFQYDGTKYNQLPADAIKCGDYVTVGTNFKVHVATGSDDTPSIYVNPRAIELVGYGTAIISSGGVDPTAMFGGQARQLPPGASAAPVAPAGAPGMPGMAPQPGQMPMQPQPAPMMPGAAPAPMMAPPAPPAPPPPAPVAPAGPQRPVDPTHIANAGTTQEMWWNPAGNVWIPAPVMAPPAPPAPMMPPPAPDFVQNAGMQPAPMMPGQMPGMMAPR